MNRGKGAERHAVATEARRRVLMVRHPPDVRQTIGCLNHLARPPVREIDRR